MSGFLLFLAVYSFIVTVWSKDPGKRNAAMICTAIYLVGAFIVK